MVDKDDYSMGDIEEIGQDDKVNPCFIDEVELRSLMK